MAVETSVLITRFSAKRMRVGDQAELNMGVAALEQQLLGRNVQGPFGENTGGTVNSFSRPV